jgi:phosphoglycolate/pyridoxal phosphate phosphatase family enzyme
VTATPSPTVFVFDLDGVLYRGDEIVAGAPEALARLRARGAAVRLFFLTNNSSQTRRTYVDKLTRMGMPCTEDEIVTSASATAAYIADNYAPLSGRTAYVVGGAGIADELSRIGVTARLPRDSAVPDERFDFVIAGLDRDFNYATLERAQQAILDGAAFIATNRDGQFPLEGGRVIPGGGTMVAAIEASTDVKPAVIGKPEPLGLQTILRRAGCAPGEAVMIGDRLDTDVLCGNRIGVPTVLVLTGVTDLATARAATGDTRPGRIIESLNDL